jgi:type I restriction enzyme S subunit
MTDIPKSWRKARFGDIFKVKYGKAIDKNLRKDTARFPVVGSAGVMTRTDVPLASEPTIVIGRKGNVGSIQVFEDGCYPIDTTYYMQATSEFDIKFLTYLLTSLELVKLDSSTATPSLRREDLENVSLIVPSIDEQHKIVELLENHLVRLDAALADVKQAKIKAAQFRSSLLKSAFTGNLNGDGTRLITSYPSNWKIESLDSLINRGIIKLNRGDIISKRDIAAHPGDYPIYSSAKENDGMFGRYGKYMFDEEVITWSIDGGGRLFYREKQKFSVTNVGGILRIIDKSVFDYKFLFYALTNLHSQVIFDWSRKAHPSVIRLVYDKVPIPPLPEQHKIVELLEDHLSSLDASVAISDAMEKQSVSLRRSLLQAAFTGQLTKEVASV